MAEGGVKVWLEDELKRILGFDEVSYPIFRCAQFRQVQQFSPQLISEWTFRGTSSCPAIEVPLLETGRPCICPAILFPFILWTT